jgi:fumarate reductase flavoprotein subunit
VREFDSIVRMTSSPSSPDVLIVGGGIAGLVAANRAAQLGLTTLVLEKGTDERYPCSSRWTGGTFHIAYTDVASPAAELRQVIDCATAGFADPDVSAAVADDGIRLVRWLRDEGIKFLNLGKYHTFVLAPPSRTGPGLDWEGRGGDVMLRTLEANLIKRGGALRRGARASALALNEDGSVRIEVDGGPSVQARAVVLADGGFPADLQLLTQHVSPAADKLQQRNAGTATGDALRMARAVGAATVGMKAFYGHLLSRDALTNPRLWPRPYLDALAVAGIVVGRDGRRFADEGEGGVHLANAVAQLDDPLGTTLVFDSAIWAGPGASPLIPANPHLPQAGGTMFSAPTIRELAVAMDVPADALQSTVNAHNKAVATRSTAALQPRRRTDKHEPWAIAKAPFYGVPLCSGITNTMGGIVVDGQGAVLDSQRQRIRNVYAAGAATGGLEGGPEYGYVGGLVKAVFGLRAAEAIAAAGRG